MRLVLLSLLSLFALNAHADEAPAPDLRSQYTKYEYRVPMRDGTHLFTVVYTPKDDSRKLPFLMVRTPYSCAPYGVGQGTPERLAPGKEFLKAGYIFVCQDVRGRHMSEGNWLEMTPHRAKKASPKDVDESSDTFDTVQWLLDHVKNHNGRVGLWGISYPGFYTAASSVDSHPAIKAISPQAPMADIYMGDDAYHGGAFMLAANYGFYAFYWNQKNPTDEREESSFKFRNEDGYDYYLRAGNLSEMAKRLNNPLFTDAIEHDRYDAYWQSRALTPHLHGVKAAVLTVGGWFDAEDLMGPLRVNQSLNKLSPGQPHTLVMGPWVHGGWAGRPGRTLGNVSFEQDTGAFYQKNILLPFFEQHLKEGGADAKLPAAWVFETGTNVWRKFDAWPPREAKPRQLYFGAGGSLGWSAPREASAAFDSYVSDPAKPVPFIGYAAMDMPQEYMVSDQRFAASRPDVLVYQTEVLDGDVTLAGPIVAKLMASTSNTDVDWVVKLIDVYPPEAPKDGEHRERGKDVPPPTPALGGYQQLVRGQPLRARFRHGFEKAEATVPGQVEEMRVEMPDIDHTFRRGHRIMVQVQSSWFPLIDRNPQSFVTIRDARPEDFKPATQRVYRWSGQASSLSVGVIE